MPAQRHHCRHLFPARRGPRERVSEGARRGARCDEKAARGGNSPPARSRIGVPDLLFTLALPHRRGSSGHSIQALAQRRARSGVLLQAHHVDVCAAQARIDRVRLGGAAAARRWRALLRGLMMMMRGRRGRRTRGGLARPLAASRRGLGRGRHEAQLLPLTRRRGRRRPAALRATATAAPARTACLAFRVRRGSAC
jgi:hypothetical protein